ncbi:MAG TPA: hypothetical protein VGK19_18485 [Capsulimonadaceae bacterium]|jgi:hypothetical protein
MRISFSAALCAAQFAISLGCLLGGPAPQAAFGSKLAVQLQHMDAVLGVDSGRQSSDFTVHETGCSAAANVFWPGDSTQFTFQIENNTKQRLTAQGHMRLLSYASRSKDWFSVEAYKVADLQSLPVSIDVDAKGFQNISLTPIIPAQFGAYALVLDIDGHGSDFAATCLRTPKSTSKSQQFPVVTMDLGNMSALPFFQRIGLKGTRIELHYVPSDSPDYVRQMDRYDAMMKAMSANGVTVMLTLEGHAPSPAGLTFRGFLDDAGQGAMTYPGDSSWLPSADADFQKFVTEACSRWGWPKGPVNAVELWNEPWDGQSISGWGADIPRYREIYTAMAHGVEEARRSAGVDVLMGGTCSSMNTEDKLFADGKDTFLPWLDFTSLHYQPMGTEPALVPMYLNRKSKYGAVRAWDTESWIANSEDRVAAVIAGMRATGLSRLNGVSHDFARILTEYRPRETPDRPIPVQYPLPTSGAIAAFQALAGDRPFRGLVFANGLPWAFIFQDDASPDDGVIIVVGDLGRAFDRDMLLYREAQTRLAGKSATLVIDNRKGQYICYDDFGNPLPPSRTLNLPLSTRGLYLRTNGSRGSFAKLITSVRSASISGMDPVEIVAHDLVTPIDQHPTLRLTITNLLNRPVAGKLSVSLGDLSLASTGESINLSAGETRNVPVTVTAGTATPSNTYPLTATFDTGSGLSTTHTEELHVNAIMRKTIKVDGSMDDWDGALPQPFHDDAAAVNATTQAWLPFVKFDATVTKGFAIAYMAYDDRYFYFGAKIADSSPARGTIRFAKRDDDQYFYPETFTGVEKDKSGRVIKSTVYHWPDGVRRFTYRKWPDLPSGSGAGGVQVGFNVLPDAQKRWLMNPPGVMPKYMMYPTTDYEYALNPVADQFGGGTEVWRLLTPLMPYKQFYPRQPMAPVDGGDVKDAQLVIKQDGATRVVEAAIPWEEIPDVKACLDSGRTIKFSARVNASGGKYFEMANHRSVSKKSQYTFHDAWSTSWSNELEFAFLK